MNTATASRRGRRRRRRRAEQPLAGRTALACGERGYDARVGSSPARLVIALSVAAALAIFVVYTALAGNGVADLTPSTLAGHSGNVSLVGAVVGKPQGDAYARGGLRFRVKDIGKATPARVPVVY